MAAAYQYQFDGDRPVILRDQVVKPGDSYSSDEPVVHGEFTPKNKAAKDHAAGLDTVEAQASEEPAATAETPKEA